MVTATDVLNKDDLIVITGAGGFIAGALARYFHEKGFRRIRAIDRKPIPEWYQRVPDVECISMDLSEKENAIKAVEGPRIWVGWALSNTSASNACARS
jgi:nucleoside-diphosphate-sugar epimerase